MENELDGMAWGSLVPADWKPPQRPEPEFHKMVLAERVALVKYPNAEPGALDLRFDFLCPNCARRHVGREKVFHQRPYFDYQLACGPVAVRFPWSDTTQRDEVDLYGNRLPGRPDPITQDGQPCRHCGAPVEKQTHSRKPKQKAGHTYYFEWWFRCPNCKAYYMVDAAKRYFDAPAR